EIGRRGRPPGPRGGGTQDRDAGPRAGGPDDVEPVLRGEPVRRRGPLRGQGRLAAPGGEGVEARLLVLRGGRPPTRRGQPAEVGRGGWGGYAYAGHRLPESPPPGGKAEQFEYDAAGTLLRQPGRERLPLREGNRLYSANGDVFEYDIRNHVRSRQGPSCTWR